MPVECKPIQAWYAVKGFTAEQLREDETKDAHSVGPMLSDLYALINADSMKADVFTSNNKQEARKKAEEKVDANKMNEGILAKIIGQFPDRTKVFEAYTLISFKRFIDEHVSPDRGVQRRFTCAGCTFRSLSKAEMLIHASSSGHTFED